MQLYPGTRVGSYEVQSPLGAGGMGEVYRARDLRLDRLVAIKILPSHLSSRHDLIARFEQEARAASSLNHPHILQIYDFGETEGVVPAERLRYITMELVEGETLGSRIGQGAPFSKLIEPLIQVADALARAHEAGIIHRDLKPENIMITRDGYAKVLDFGLAKLTEKSRLAAEPAESAATARLFRTETGIVLGTVGYMSPEQVEGRNVDARSDIFSFGCVLYEAIGARRPFQGTSTVDTLHKILHENPASLPNVSSELQRIVAKCLEKDADRRYQSIREVAVDLREVRRIAGSVAVSLPASSLNPLHSARAKLLLVAATVVVIVLVIGLRAYRSQNNVFVAKEPVGDKPVTHNVKVEHPESVEKLRTLLEPGENAELGPESLVTLIGSPIRVKGLAYALQIIDSLHGVDFYRETNIFRVGHPSAARVSWAFEGINPSLFLRAVHAGTGWSIGFDEAVLSSSASVTVFAEQLPWDRAVQSVLNRLGFVAHRYDKIWIITTPESSPALRWYEPLRVIEIDLKKHSPQAVANLLDKVRSPEGLVLVHSRTGGVILVDRFHQFELFRETLRTIGEDDLPTPAVPTDQRPFMGEPIDVYLHSQKVVSALNRFSKLSGLSVAIEEEKESRPYMLAARQVPWDECLEVILVLNGLRYEVAEGVLEVFPVNKKPVEPATVRTVRVMCDPAELFLPLQRLLKPSGQIVADRARVIIIRGEKSSVEWVEAVIRKIDAFRCSG